MFRVEVLEIVVREPSVLVEFHDLSAAAVVTAEGDVWSADAAGNLDMLLAEHGEWWAVRITDLDTGATTLIPALRPVGVGAR